MSNVKAFTGKKLQRATCDHKNQFGEFDYHMAHNGLCFCVKCGMCMNSRIENYKGFEYNKADRERLIKNANETRKFAGRL
jgi:hypothetical protein